MNIFLLPDELRGDLFRVGRARLSPRRHLAAIPRTPKSGNPNRSRWRRGPAVRRRPMRSCSSTAPISTSGGTGTAATVQWSLADGAVTVVRGTGDIFTRESFGDIQLHVECADPRYHRRGRAGARQQRHHHSAALRGAGCSIPGRTAPIPTARRRASTSSTFRQVNASRPPGEWQSYDIFFTAPRFADDGSLTAPAYVTVVHNGVLMQNHVGTRGPDALHRRTELRAAPAQAAAANSGSRPTR